MKNNIFVKAICLITVTVAMSATAAAEIDITSRFLKNYGFDSHFDHKSGETTTVAQELNNVRGWISELSADYTILGVYEYGFKGKINGTVMPTNGYEETTGGALAVSTGWGQTFYLYQDVTLPAGEYTISAPTYNMRTVVNGVSGLAWIPNTGTAVTSELTSYPSKVWTTDCINVKLTKQTKGKIRIGYKAAANTSTNSANILIDNVKITTTKMTVSKRTVIASAKSLYGNGTGNGAEELKAVWDATQATFDNTEASDEDIIIAYYNLLDACELYRQRNASEEKPLNRTSYIVNPSFETNGTSGWEIRNLNLQSNSVFNKKDGTYYAETWVNIGDRIGEASASQTICFLPRGYYKLTAAALHIQQSGSGSIYNKGEPQTGAFLFAGNTKEAVTSIKQYDLKFAVVEDEEDIKIGLMTENPTGNYLCVDNFTLQYIGMVTSEVIAEEVQHLMDEAQAYFAKGVQNPIAEMLSTAIAAAQTALAGIGTDDEGKTIYDDEALLSAKKALEDAIIDAKASRELYDALQARINYAEKVRDWWEGVSRKATSHANLVTAINTAKEKLTDYTLTAAQLTAAAKNLNTRIAAVDKKIYCSTNACGTDEQLQVPTNQWCYERSMQSKHWILFWEAGYGKDAPSAVPGILDNADRIFELYANSLEFITINKGTSKTDTYKMIIRLRHTTEWEASGSGIDDKIGLLTLSNGAHTSRGGQTVAHEIGHCFQYQTHCDNGNWNGWMYNWGASTLNVFWEMCAQWQAYKYYPAMQFDNEWLWNTINGMHRHPLSVHLRYNNYFIQDYFCHKHGIGFLGTLWNKSQYPEDPLQAYMRLTMTGNDDEKLDQLNNEMWEYGARMTTFDIDPIRDYGAARINYRSQTALTEDSEGFWSPEAGNCIENFGNNAIRLNVPSGTKTVYAELIGEAGKDGYTTYNKTKAGWKFGFVALLNNGERVYGDIATATYDTPHKYIAFDSPSGCTYLWLVVSGAPTAYWTRDWLSWDEESIAEQWPYRVKLHQTNVYGNPNNNTYPTAVTSPKAANTENNIAGNVYSVNGQLVRKGTTSLEGLPKGLYVVNGKIVSVR